MLADELWEKHCSVDGTVHYQKFIAAIKEAMEAVREKAVAKCMNESLVEPCDTADDIAYDNAVKDCAAAIKQMELP